VSARGGGKKFGRKCSGLFELEQFVRELALSVLLFDSVASLCVVRLILAILYLDLFNCPILFVAHRRFITAAAPTSGCVVFTHSFCLIQAYCEANLSMLPVFALSHHAILAIFILLVPYMSSYYRTVLWRKGSVVSVHLSFGMCGRKNWWVHLSWYCRCGLLL